MAGIKKLKRLLFIFYALTLLLAGWQRSWADASTNRVFISLVGATPTLVAGVTNNGQIRLTLTGESGVRYVVESSPDLSHWSPVATNNDNTSRRILNLSAPTAGNFYRATRDALPLFTYALAAQGNISMKGIGLVTDSWNSRDPAQSTNGLYNNYPGTNGSVASASGIVSITSHTINGSLYLGTNAFFVYSPFQVTGQIYPDYDVWIPDVVLPKVNWLSAPGNSTSHDFTTNGYYTVNDSGNIIVEPNVRAILQVTASNFSPASTTIKGGTTNSGTLVVYLNQGTMTLNGGAISYRPENFIILGLPGLTNISLVFGNAQFFGVVYAPEANMIVSGGGNGLGIYGSCIVNSLNFNGHYIFHFDEGLLSSGPVR